jgi:hypothetical protein
MIQIDDPWSLDDTHEKKITRYDTNAYDIWFLWIETHKNFKFFKKTPNVGEMKGLEIYEYRLPLGTNIYIYEIYDSKDNTHQMPYDDKNG